MDHFEVLIQSARRALFFREFPRAKALLAEALPLSEQRGVETFVYRALGDAHCGCAEFAEAVASYRRALATQRGTSDPDHASLLSNLGYALDQLERFDESEPLHTEALGIQTRLHGKGHPALIQPLTNLGFGLAARVDHTRAEACLAEAARIAEASLGPRHPGLAQPLNNLGELCRRAGDLPRASALLARALDIMREAVPDQEHPDLIAFLDNNAAILRQLGQEQEAASLADQAERIRQRS